MCAVASKSWPHSSQSQVGIWRGWVLANLFRRNQALFLIWYHMPSENWVYSCVCIEKKLAWSRPFKRWGLLCHHFQYVKLHALWQRQRWANTRDCLGWKRLYLQSKQQVPWTARCLSNTAGTYHGAALTGQLVLLVSDWTMLCAKGHQQAWGSICRHMFEIRDGGIFSFLAASEAGQRSDSPSV